MADMARANVVYACVNVVNVVYVVYVCMYVRAAGVRVRACCCVCMYVRAGVRVRECCCVMHVCACGRSCVVSMVRPSACVGFLVSAPTRFMFDN